MVEISGCVWRGWCDKYDIAVNSYTIARYVSFGISSIFTKLRQICLFETIFYLFIWSLFQNVAGCWLRFICSDGKVSWGYCIMLSHNPAWCRFRTLFLCSCAEVALKVHLSDASTHQPLSDATVEVFANHTPVTRENSGSDGNIFIRFPYRLGDLLVITATKRGYVPSSAPWKPARLPGTI